MRILMTTDTVGGVWDYAVQLARSPAPAGVAVTLAAVGRTSAVQRAQAAGLTLVESDFRLEWMDDPWADVAASGAWLLGLEREHRPHVVHLNGYAHGRLPFVAPTVVVGHSCVGSWWQAVKGEPAPPGRYHDEVTAGLHAATAVVAPTRAMLAELDRLYGPARDATVIYNGRSPDDFRPADKRPFVLSAGRLWDEAKNLATLRRAAAGLPWPVRVAGDGGAGGGVDLLGKLSAADMAAAFAAASIYCLPARYEPFGLSVLEAALSGCALVLGDIPTLRELWEGAAAFVAPDRRRRTAGSSPTADRRPGPAGRPGRASATPGRPVRRRSHVRRVPGPVPPVGRRGRNERPPLAPARPAPRPGRTDRHHEIVGFYHSLRSDWNHGNAHFLRGVVGELLHAATTCGSTSRPTTGPSGTSGPSTATPPWPPSPPPTRVWSARAFPTTRPRSTWTPPSMAVDLVLMHEWNDHALVARVGQHRRAGGRYRLLFHDTHHRAVTDPAAWPPTTWAGTTASSPSATSSATCT